MLAQVLAIIIFLAMFLLIILEIWERQWITLACGLLTLLLVFGLGMHSMGAIMRTLNLQSFFTTGFWYAAGESSEASSGINWQTIIFIAGMMIMVEGMAKVGFFRWLCMEIAKMVKYQVIPIFMTFMLLSFVLAMFIDSITVILFLAAVTIELSQLLEFDPVPMILSEIFCANLGGSATMCGDPPNIIIGTSLGYSFTDFITNTGLMALYHPHPYEQNILIHTMISTDLNDRSIHDFLHLIKLLFLDHLDISLLYLKNYQYCHRLITAISSSYRSDSKQNK